MKFSKFLCLCAAIVLLATLLTACGGSLAGVSSVKKYLNEDYDPSEEVLSKMEKVEELDGYVYIGHSEEFAVFSKAVETGLSYKIFSMRNAKVVATIAEENVVCTFDLTANIPALLVTKTKTFTDSSLIETTYLLYDGMGNQVATSNSATQVPVMFADKLVYNYMAYTVAEDGALKDGVKVPEYAVLSKCDSWNDEYYYVETMGGVIVYDRSFETVSVWTAPSYAANFAAFPMNDGNVLIQYTYSMAEDAKKYDYYDLGYVGNTVKMDMVSLILSAEKGKVKEIDLDYLVLQLMPNYELYDEDEENNEYREDFENIAVIAPIEDKKLNNSEDARDIVLMNNKGKAQKSLKMIDNQGANLPRKVAEDVYLTKTLYGSALINGKGKLIQPFYTATGVDLVGEYFVGERMIYNLQMEEVYDLDQNKATVEKIMDNTIFVKKKTDTGYEMISFCDGKQTTVYTHTPDVKTVLTFAEEDDYYVIYDQKTQTYQYYNADGTQLSSINYMPIKLCKSNSYGTILCWNNDGALPSYCVMVQ